jgi:hypothetical protein
MAHNPADRARGKPLGIVAVLTEAPSSRELLSRAVLLAAERPPDVLSELRSIVPGLSPSNASSFLFACPVLD